MIDDSMFFKGQQSQQPTGNIDDSVFFNKDKPSTPTVADSISDNRKTLSSAANAVAIGIEHGVNTVSSMLGKAITPYTSKLFKSLGIPEKYLETPESTQQEYLNLNKLYNESPDTNAHPIISGAANLAGNLAMTAPLAYMGGGATAGLLSNGAADAGLGPLAQLAAKGAGYTLSNAAQGGIMGGLTNTPDLGTSAWNQPGAKTGALLGGTVGALGNAVLDRYTGQLDKYSDFSNQMQKLGYNGPIFQSDIPANQGMWSDIKQGLVNNVVGKIPFINDIPGVGLNSARNAQIKGINSATQQLVQNLADSNPNASLRQFQNILGNSKQLAEKSITDASNTFRQSLNDAGITSANMQQSFPLAQDLINNTDKGIISSKVLPVLEQIKPDTDINNLLTTDGVTGIKNTVWKEYERLNKLGLSNTNASDAAKDMRQLYHSINSDINGSISGAPNNVIQDFHNFNTITSNIKQLWDPQNSPALALAADNLNKSQKGLKSFFNGLKNNTYTPDITNKYNNILGQQGQNVISDSLLQDAYQSSIKNGQLDTQAFLSNPKLNKAIENGQVNQNSVDVIKGLQYMLGKANEGLQAGNTDGAIKVGLAGALGAGSHFIPGVNALLIGAQALGTLSAHSPLKNSLMMLNKMTNKPDLSQYMINKISNNITRLGLHWVPNEDNSFSLMTKDEKPNNIFDPTAPVGTTGIRG